MNLRKRELSGFVIDWWLRSAFGGFDSYTGLVYNDGSGCYDYHDYYCGVVSICIVN